MKKKTLLTETVRLFKIFGNGGIFGLGTEITHSLYYYRKVTPDFLSFIDISFSYLHISYIDDRYSINDLLHDFVRNYNCVLHCVEKSS